MDNISPEQYGRKLTNGRSRSEDAQMVISDRKWSLALQLEQNAGGFEVIKVVTRSV